MRRRLLSGTSNALPCLPAAAPTRRLLSGTSRAPSRLPAAAPPPTPPAPPAPAFAPPALLQQRRTAVELALLAPRAVERVTIVEQVRRVSFNVLGLGLGVTLLVLYAAMRAHNPGVDLARMKAAVAWLRRARVAARARLLGAAQEQGEVALEGSAGRALKWWASGPRSAPVTVLLAAEDGESAAVWGEVHARLASALGAGARIVSYHCTGGAAAPPPVPGAAAAPALLLRVRDAEQALAAAGGKQGGVVHVHMGAGAWAALALAALHPARTAGVVLVAPLLYHRQRALAWVDAVPAASRVPEELDPGLLQRLLDPPPPPTAQPLTPQQQALMDASSPRRKDMVGFWERFGTQGARAAAEQRFAEDFRRWRARQMVLSSREVALVRALAPSLAGASPPIPMRALTWGVGALPSWMERTTARASALHFVQAATAAGAMLAPPSAALRAAEAARAEQAATAAATVPDLLVKVQPTEAVHVGALLANLPAALGLQQPRVLAEVDARMALLEGEVGALPRSFSVTLVEGGGEGLEEDGRHDLAVFPLQCPQAVVAEVLAALQGAGQQQQQQQGKGFQRVALG